MNVHDLFCTTSVPRLSRAVTVTVYVVARRSAAAGTKRTVRVPVSY